MIRGENDEHIKGCNRLAQQHHVDCKFIIYYAKIIVKRLRAFSSYFLYDLYYTRPDRAKRADLLPRVLYYMRDFAVENRLTKNSKYFSVRLGLVRLSAAYFEYGSRHDRIYFVRTRQHVERRLDVFRAVLFVLRKFTAVDIQRAHKTARHALPLIAF